MSEELDRLRDAVNVARYRGLNGKGPLGDNFHWPMSYGELEAIARAALALILAEESTLAASIQQNPEAQSPS